MRLEHLYRLRFAYEAHWAVGPQRFGLAEGSCEGRVAGRFRGSNHARIREDGVYLPDLRGVIEVDGGGVLLVEIAGRGRVREDGSFAATGSVTHASDGVAHGRLDDVVCVLEAASGADDESLTVDVYELVPET